MSTTTETALTEEQWRQRLTPEQFKVLRKHGTERAGTSPLNAEKRAGTFVCAGCGQPIFDSATKFESGTGWPSFWQPLEGATEEQTDRSFFTTRTEVHCARCKGHLGHVFDDGPRPTGLRLLHERRVDEIRAGGKGLKRAGSCVQLRVIP